MQFNEDGELDMNEGLKYMDAFPETVREKLTQSFRHCARPIEGDFGRYNKRYPKMLIVIDI